MKKKTILFVLAIILLLGCGIGSWLYFRQPEEPDDGGWVWVSQYFQEGALSKSGYYYIENNILTYADIATQKSAVLCSRAVCTHDGEECDAYLGNLVNRNMFYGNGRLYYVLNDNDGSHLYSRDATGAALVKVCSFGRKFVEQKKSVEIERMVIVDHFLYCKASVDAEIEGTIQHELEYLSRVDLNTGREEILIEETLENSGEHLWLVAVSSSGVLFSHSESTDVDRDSEEHLEALRMAPHSLKQWDGETGTVTTLFRKTVKDFSNVQMVYGGKVYCKALTTAEDGSGGAYTYDLATGEETQFESAALWHMGGGYAFRRIDDKGNYDILSLHDGRSLPNVLNDISRSGRASVLSFSGKGVVLQWGSKELRKDNPSDSLGYQTLYYDFVSYTSLADGLQETDLVHLRTSETQTSDPDMTTPPTETAPQVTEPVTDESIYSFEPEPPIADKDTTKKLQYLPQTVDNPQNLPVLKWVCLLNDSSRITFTENAVHDLNRMLESKNMPFRIQIIIMTYERKMTASGSNLEWLSSPDALELLQAADLIYAPMDPSERKEYLMPITDYVAGDAQPSLKNAVPHELLWLAASADGEIYGIANEHWPQSTGWFVDAAFMHQQGLTAEDFAHEYWEMDELFARLYEANGNEPFLAVPSGKGYLPLSGLHGFGGKALPETYQPIGALFAIDYSAEVPAVVNLLETEDMRKIRDAINRYTEAGYIVPNTIDANTRTKVSFGLTYSHKACSFNVEYTIEDGETAWDQSIMIPVTPTVYSYDYGADNMIAGIAAVSQHKKEALSLLHLIAEDAQFRDQLCYGTEGQDYDIIDGKLTVRDELHEYYEEISIDGGTSIYKRKDHIKYDLRFLSPLSRYSTLVEEDLSAYPIHEGKTKLQTHMEIMDNTVYVAYPMTFDFSGMEQELNSICLILEEYLPSESHSGKRQSPQYDGLYSRDFSEEQYDQLLEDLNNAGAAKLQAELQRQLDEWLAANPDWSK